MKRELKEYERAQSVLAGSEIMHTAKERNLSAAMRRAREHTGVSLRAAAKALGVSAAYLSDVERGNRAPTPQTIGYYTRHFATTEDKDNG